LDCKRRQRTPSRRRAARPPRKSPRLRSPRPHYRAAGTPPHSRVGHRRAAVTASREEQGRIGKNGGGGRAVRRDRARLREESCEVPVAAGREEWSGPLGFERLYIYKGLLGWAFCFSLLGLSGHFGYFG
jgi:hypothetical protein